MRQPADRSSTGPFAERGLWAIAFVAFAALLSYCGNRQTLDHTARPNVVLVTIDTVRADHLESYGAPRQVAPNIARLASSGVLYERAISQASWTLPAMASILTSHYPPQHGAVKTGLAIRPSSTTLAEIFRDTGYRTIGVVSHTFVNEKHGFSRGFELFDESQAKGHDGVTSQALTRIALRGLGTVGERPYFLWVHYFDPHYTYSRHQEYRFASGFDPTFPSAIAKWQLDQEAKRYRRSKRRSPSRMTRYIEAVYDEEIAHTDHWIGELLAGLPSSRRPTLIAITADHGEFFLDRFPKARFGHGRDVYQPLVHVPLIIGGDVPRGLRGRTVRSWVETASVAKTLLEAAGIRTGGIQGVDLLALAAGKPAPTARLLYAEGALPNGARLHRSVIAPPWKLIQAVGSNHYELYHLDSDPDERRDRANEEGEPTAVRRRLALALDDLVEQAANAAGGVAAPRVGFSEEEIERLRALGYSL